MSQHILYPKPLPDLVKYTVVNECGFSPTEIAALQNGWRLFKRRFYYHAKYVFMEFFNEHDLLLERFRDNATGKFNLTNLYQHPQQLLNVYGNLIESGLSNAAYINLLLTDVSRRHKMYGVKEEEIKLYTDYFAKYITGYLDKRKSPTFLTGLNKLNELIRKHHYEESEDINSQSHSEILE